MTRFDVLAVITAETETPRRQVASTLELLADGNTVPFIARYRKEATGGLDEVKIREIQERHAYITELEERRQTILKSIEEQGKLTQELRGKISACSTKSSLEDLYLPYKPKRRTRATLARERGLEPLSERIRSLPGKGDPLSEARAYVDPEKQVPDAEAALAGARDIVAEWISENADVRAHVRQSLGAKGVLRSEAVPKKAVGPTKFEQYYEFREPVRGLPSHRFLAIRRGEREGVLRVRLELEETEQVLGRLGRMVGYRDRSPFSKPFGSALEDAYARLLLPSVETEVLSDLKSEADRQAVEVFARNLGNLLLSPPLGGQPVIAIDPGIRTGCKCVGLDATGKLLGNITIYPSQGEAAAAKARRDFAAFVDRFQPYAVAVGNGTGGRETEAFVRKVLETQSERQVVVVSVNESGASVYSASEVAREEFPDLDLTVRGAVSIGRRLQDPLAELVKIDPKSIGVGQYQHDVHQPLLVRKLDTVVEDCVNAVGVELDTASASLLSYVAGIGPNLAKKIVAHREQNGPFKSRKQLNRVSGLGPKTFVQAAGFLRVRNGQHALDASAVHPERYELVEQMASDLGAPLNELVGNGELAKRIDISRYVGDGVGEPTLRDIVAELGKPGRDPRATFEPPQFRDDVTEMEDLREGMELEGVVTNVTAFGAFVDVGVHQDGLVHISEMADHFVKDPHKELQVGQRLKVRVLNLDVERRRIGLSARRGTDRKRG